MMDMPCALVVDDEPANRDFLMRLIHQAGYEVYGAASAQEALDMSVDLSPALVILDHQLPDMKGTELLKTLRAAYAGAKLVMATMHDDRNYIEAAFANGCDAYLVKPHGFMELFKRLQSLSDLDQLVFDSLGVRKFRP